MSASIGLGMGGLLLAADSATDLGRWGLLFAIVGGAIRVGTPFLFVSLGECITEKSGRVNLGLEGTLVMGAMTGYAISYQDGLAVGRRVGGGSGRRRCWARFTR